MTLDRIELHLHLEGAAPPDFVRRLADEQHVSLAELFDERGNYAFRDFVDFLRVYEGATSVLRTPEHYYRLTAEVLEHQAEQGILYTETFLSPDFCGGGDVEAWRDYLAAIRAAADEAEARHGTILRGIVTAIRHFGPQKARATVRCAAETAGKWIVGFGIGGDEGRGSLSDFAWSFDAAREAQLGLTAHAGEWGGPASVHEALTLGVSRLGHGVRAIEDRGLVDHLAERGITLEVCPGSNVALGLYPDWPDHPVQRLRAAGVQVTISTDDPPFFATDMSHEYARLQAAFDWTDEDFAAINRTAADAAFCDAATRRRLQDALEPAA